jgi:hypothetical protein
MKINFWRRAGRATQNIISIGVIGGCLGIAIYGFFTGRITHNKSTEGKMTCKNFSEIYEDSIRTQRGFAKLTYDTLLTLTCGDDTVKPIEERSMAISSTMRRYDKANYEVYLLEEREREAREWCDCKSLAEYRSVINSN